MSYERLSRCKVYIAGPYTKGDVAINVKTAIETANELIELGFIPFIPHLTHFWHMICPQPYEFWLELDNKFLPLCECVLRIPGESSGADAEVLLAKKQGIPVFYSIKELTDFCDQ